ncbi:hypothetical protein PIB30_089071 [Stylosanthes scabra]|uniref:Uncharacterized protein n=1 Tax=Stylosanthes scabra TaxID=79078 RepID=A0ABU6TVW0_9FABA|nr:hypothetical protein [Stylosanthes scabra]
MQVWQWWWDAPGQLDGSDKQGGGGGNNSGGGTQQWGSRTALEMARDGGGDTAHRWTHSGVAPFTLLFKQRQETTQAGATTTDDVDGVTGTTRGARWDGCGLGAGWL